MSVGQGASYDKRIKMELLQEQANKDMVKIDQMIEENQLEPYKAYLTLGNQYKSEVKQQKLVLPYETKDKFVGIANTINGGYDDYHKKPSLNKEFNSEIDNRFANRKDPQLQKTLKNESTLKSKELQQRIIYSSKDHLGEIEKGMGFQNLNSTNRQELNYTKDMDVNNKNIDHYYHIKKNDLNSYAEAYVKQKLTIRK